MIIIDNDAIEAVSTIQQSFGFVTTQVFHLSDEATEELPAHLRNLCWGMVDRCRSYTTYAPIVMSSEGQAVPDFQHSQTFWDDEVIPA